MGDTFVFLLILQALLVTALPSLKLVASVPNNLRGVAPQDEKYYSAETIWCRDGSKSFSFERLNDDFCDCVDGTDEPGTSACPSGKFHCKNKGHTPVSIFSSRVNDGICDCCDGSDEYDGKTKCPNTCSEAGKVLTERLERKIATFKGGLEVRKRDVEHAKHMIQKDKVELSNLRQEEKKLKDAVHKLKARKEAIEKAEKQEQLKQEKEEQKRREVEKQESTDDVTEVEKAQHSQEESSPKDILNDVEQSEVEGEAESDSAETKDSKDLSKEELGRLIASRWTGEDPGLQERVPAEERVDHSMDADEEDFHDDEGGFNSDQDQADGTATEDDDEEYESEDADEQKEPTETKDSTDHQVAEISQKGWVWTKLEKGLRALSNLYSFSRVPIDKSEADHVRKEYDSSSSKLADIQSKISDLEKKLEQDFGKDGEFYSFYNQCFELRLKKYVYKVCPFRNSLQVEGHSTTTLGNWDGFKDDYKSMQFVRGDRCWNGPDRSLKVNLRCGVKIEVRDVDEPSRCEYVADLSTPAVCLEERLAALQQRLNNKREDLHEEL